MFRLLSVQLEDGGTVTASGPADIAVHEGDACVVEVNRVQEVGHVLRLAEKSGEWAAHPTGAVLLRRATIHDQAKAKENAVVGRMALKSALKRIDELRLPMHLVFVRYSFDRSVLHITYTAEEKLECGELIKGLAGELRTRIELRQTGVRDAARAVGGMGTCGRALCCCTWLQNFEAVSVKMAKAQRIALNPSTIGGMCGRLKCCLRYEFDQYCRVGESLPRDGARVRCPDGCGVVVDKDVMAQRLRVRLEDGRVLDVEADGVKPLADDEQRPTAGGGKPRHEDSRTQRPQS